MNKLSPFLEKELPNRFLQTRYPQLLNVIGKSYDHQSFLCRERSIKISMCQFSFTSIHGHRSEEIFNESSSQIAQTSFSKKTHRGKKNSLTLSNKDEECSYK